MLALVVDTSAQPELLTPELCVTSVTMNQISLTTRLALNEFRASYYSYHRSQSALSETNRLLRVSGCNLNLNPYLVIQMGRHHGHPLTGPWNYVPTTEARPWESHLEIPKDLRIDTDPTVINNQ